MERDFLERRLAQGLSLEQIGREVGLHGTTVAYWDKKYHLAATGAERFAARGAPDKQTVERLVNEGATLQEIAHHVDRSIATVRYWLTKWNVPRSGRSARVDTDDAPRIVDRTCKRHGLTRFGLEGRGYYRCLLCRQERVSAWRRRVKQTLIDEAGRACQLCGYDRCAAALQFHHLDPAAKSFALSDDGVARNIERARREAAKCILLCANCHAEVEVGFTSVTVREAAG